MLTTAFGGRCPACDEGQVFAGVYAIKERCDHCGVVFLREDGTWIGATVVAYMLGSVFAVLLILLLWSTGRLFEPSAQWIVPGGTVLFLLVAFRFVKGFWVGLMYEWGFVYADPPAPPAPPAPPSPPSP